MSSFPILPGRAVAIGMSTVPYVLGSSKNGSGTDNKSAGPWEYEAVPEDTESEPRTDTWHRDRPPTNEDDIVTEGVILDIPRIYVEYGSSPDTSFTVYTFTRKVTVDSMGLIVFIDKENIESTYNNSGSGSASGGI